MAKQRLIRDSGFGRWKGVYNAYTKVPKYQILNTDVHFL